MNVQFLYHLGHDLSLLRVHDTFLFLYQHLLSLEAIDDLLGSEHAFSKTAIFIEALGVKVLILGGSYLLKV